MLSSARALSIAARAQRMSKAVSMLGRRSSSAARGKVLSVGASPRFMGASLATPSLAAIAIVAAAGAGLRWRNDTDTGSSLLRDGEEEDPTAPPQQQLALSSALGMEQETPGVVAAARRLAAALARFPRAVYRQFRILLRLAEIILVTSPCLVTYPIAVRCVP
jgi:hypothetical protein